MATFNAVVEQKETNLVFKTLSYAMPYQSYFDFLSVSTDGIATRFQGSEYQGSLGWVHGAMRHQLDPEILPQIATSLNALAFDNNTERSTAVGGRVRYVLIYYREGQFLRKEFTGNLPKPLGEMIQRIQSDMDEALRRHLDKY